MPCTAGHISSLSTNVMPTGTNTPLGAIPVWPACHAPPPRARPRSSRPGAVHVALPLCPPAVSCTRPNGAESGAQPLVLLLVVITPLGTTTDRSHTLPRRLEGWGSVSLSVPPSPSSSHHTVCPESKPYAPSLRSSGLLTQPCTSCSNASSSLAQAGGHGNPDSCQGELSSAEAAWPFASVAGCWVNFLM